MSKNKIINIRTNTWKSAKVNTKGEYNLSDISLRGYYIRVLPSGHKTYNIRTKVLGRLHYQLIGDCQLISEADARKKALEYKQTIREGKKPELIDESFNDKTNLLDILEAYKKERGAFLKQSTYEQYKGNLNRCPLAKKPTKDLTSKVIKKWYQDGEGTPHATEYTFKNIKTLINYAFHEKIIPQNVIDELAYLGRYQPNVSEEHIPLDEIDAYMGAFVSLSPTLPHYEKERKHSDNQPNPLSVTMRDYILFLLVTGLRKGEASELLWKNVDFKKKVFDVPYNKTSRFMRVPMTVLTHDMLAWRKKQKFSDTHVFPNRKGNGGINDPRKALAKISDYANLSYKSPHAMRHTFSTYCSELGYELDDIGRLLNHAKRNITDSYVAQMLNKQRKQYHEVWKLIESKLETWVNMAGKTHKSHGVYNYHRVHWYGVEEEAFHIETAPSKEPDYWDYLK